MKVNFNEYNNNEEALKDAKEISSNYARIIEARKELSGIAIKVKEQNQITPDDFVELISQIMNLSYVLSDLEIERVIEENYNKKVLKEIKENDRSKTNNIRK